MPDLCIFGRPYSLGGTTSDLQICFHVFSEMDEVFTMLFTCCRIFEVGSLGTSCICPGPIDLEFSVCSRLSP